jgi:rhodanese-related sulfurtransferase/transcriptional regulator with XRE-family HTH domain
VVKVVNLEEGQVMIADPGVDVIDVREPSEYAGGHVPRARLVPLAEVLAAPHTVSQGRPMLIVCARGGRSLRAAEAIVPQVSHAVASLDGGTLAWQAAGLEIVVPERAGDSAAARGASEEREDQDEVSAFDVLVGDNIRALRQSRGYTLDVLAGLSGVGRQTLGQIELGRTVPGLGTLWKIARAFEVPFSALLAQKGSTPTRVLRAAKAKRLVSADGRFASRALFPFGEGGEPKVEFYELWLAGHGREDAEAHAPGTRENLVVTRGRLALEVGQERFELAAGDAIVFRADVTHAYINPAAEECWMNLVMTY